MTTEHQELFYSLLDKYNDGTEPLTNWETADIVRLGHVLDAELQKRHDEFAGYVDALRGDEQEEYDEDAH